MACDLYCWSIVEGFPRVALAAAQNYFRLLLQTLANIAEETVLPNLDFYLSTDPNLECGNDESANDHLLLSASLKGPVVYTSSILKPVMQVSVKSRWSTTDESLVISSNYSIEIGSADYKLCGRVYIITQLKENDGGDWNPYNNLLISKVYWILYLMLGFSMAILKLVATNFFHSVSWIEIGAFGFRKFVGHPQKSFGNFVDLLIVSMHKFALYYSIFIFRFLAFPAKCTHNFRFRFIIFTFLKKI